jgi:hypothetical protein
MDRINKFTSIGIYSPTFFKIQLITGDNIEDLFKNGISERGEAAFLHEYIHLLQDITTNSGLSNICRTVDYLKYINEISQTQTTIKVPFLPEDNKYNISTNFKLAKIYAGSSTTKYSRVKNVLLKSVKLMILDEEKEIKECVINLIGDKGNLIEYIVGEYAISESMAYCIENILYKDVLEKPNNYPYNVVKIVADIICPELSLDPLNLVALCDATLMYFNPGEILFLALSRLKKMEYKKMSPEDIYDMIINIVPSFDFYGDKNTKDLFDYLSPLSSKQITDYFTTDHYEKNKKWLEQVFNYAHEIRSKKPHIMLDIAKNGRIKDNIPLLCCINSIGCPVILNADKSLIVPIVNEKIDISKLDPSCFWTINQIYSIFSKKGALQHNTYKCEMIEWCKNSFKKNKVDDLTKKGDCCIYAPWERANKDEEYQICPFAQIWYSWGMKNFKPNDGTGLNHL